MERTIERLRQTMPSDVPLYESLLARARWLAEHVETINALRKPEAGGAEGPTRHSNWPNAPAGGGRPGGADRQGGLAAWPTRANDLRAGYRDKAARDAALAAAGQGEEPKRMQCGSRP